MSTAHLRTRLAQMDASIAEHKLSLEALERDRTTVATELYSTATFPILTLPVEITTAIFTLCLPTIEELHEYNRRWRADPETPLTLTAPTILVECCRAWRDIALATPSLWTTLPLGLKDTDFGDTTASRATSELGRADEYIDRWLGRAGFQPLTFVFCLVQDLDDDGSGERTPGNCIRGAIRRYADRLQQLDLDTTEACFDIQIWDFNSIHFPLLQRVVLRNTDPDQNTPDACELFGNAPRLSEVGLQPGCWLSYYIFPWTQLTNYEGDIEDMSLFRLAPNLVEMKCPVWEITYGYIQTVAHTHLQSLTLSGSNSTVSWVLMQLALPALLSLRISKPVAPVPLATCLERSAPPLRTLSLSLYPSRCYGLDPWKPSLASVAATLENLELHSPSEQFLSGISGILHLTVPEDPFSLPCLKTLSIFNSPAVNYRELVAFLHQRSTSTKFARLQSLRLVHCPGVLPTDEEFDMLCFDAGRRRWRLNATDHNNMRRLASEGMDIHIGFEKTTPVSFDKRVTFDAQPEEQ
ncbi:hypothetical protein C8F04DRAFT_1069640 [Mycena alexandri]|uniref:F-box domain-containing protein n=1 Tax=Mycena alexandri TaxID=1745969 RepID=A0AAD6TFN7_9AGAR|nr:hypothetical protein C8F04DRAFT_1069640 [Mycena alexandri]